MRAEVPILLTGIAFGVKNEGGVLDQVLREVEIECLPSDIPASIEVDVAQMKIGDVIRVADLPHGGKFRFVTDEEATVAHLAMMKEEPATAEALAAAAEPEVAKKGKGDAAAPADNAPKK